jgi:Tol biopolymer transport system component
MGEVYRARDTKLDRDVAIKVLSEAFAHDAERLARFLREAKTLAALNHPNIAAIYGLEDADGTKALVMELVEGDDLSQRIARGAIPLDEALPIAKQIAEALEAAHEHGIIHRDLKPANIKVRGDGMVKVLDFGLAKAMEPTGAMAASASMAPTTTTPALMTGAGMILGTAAYMSPEQARGKTVDKRTDIWAFGAVLFEMLTGKRPFDGEDIAETLGAVIHMEPVWSRLPTATPASVRTVLQRCLQRDPRQRLRDIGDVRLALEGAFETADGDAGTQRPDRAVVQQQLQDQIAAAVALVRRALGRRVAWVGVATLITGAIAGAAVWSATRPVPTPPETRVEINTPATDQPAHFALSPDGRQIVFVASGDGASRLWLRSLATTTAQPLQGTEEAASPFWSPDGRSVGFFAGGALKRLDVRGSGAGGAPQTLAPATNGSGGTWSADGVILFAPTLTNPVMRVSATGGAATAVTMLGPSQRGHVAPYFLPDGRRFLFYVNGSPDVLGIYLGALDGGAPTRLTPSDGTASYLPSGWLLWVRARTLVAQRLDVAKAALTGDPATLADGVAVDGVYRSAVSAAATGLVAYRTGGGSQRQLTWVDRSGTARGVVGEPDTTLLQPRVSPDGRRVIVNRNVQGNQDLWLLDGGRASRFTFDAGSERYPVWSPDGTRIVFRSPRTGASDLYQKLTSGAGAEESVVLSDQTNIATSWSADGRFLLYHSLDPQTNGDLWVVPMAGDRTPSVFLKTPFREVYGEFSPDGRWVAYHSNESGRPEVYVRPFFPPVSLNSAAGTTAAAAAGQWQVSTAGGIHPVWRPDGKALYYLNPEGAMMAGPITVAGDTLEPGAPVVLFPTRIVYGGVDNQVGRQYDVAPDGRFLINMELPGDAAPITLIQHWQPGN